MCAPSPANTGDPPLWLRINPAWQQEIQAFNDATGQDIFRALKIHGMRNRTYNEDLKEGLMSSRDQTFLEDDYKVEEGFATETRVCSRVEKFAAQNASCTL